jgi:hypothetical protein
MEQIGAMNQLKVNQQQSMIGRELHLDRATERKHLAREDFKITQRATSLESMRLCFGTKPHRARPLLHRDALGEIAWFVHVAAAGDGDMVSEKL